MRAITLKNAYADGTIAIDMDPLSLLWSASHQGESFVPSLVTVPWRNTPRHLVSNTFIR
jgi:hypothetical protein